MGYEQSSVASRGGSSLAGGMGTLKPPSRDMDPISEVDVALGTNRVSWEVWPAE